MIEIVLPEDGGTNVPLSKDRVSTLDARCGARTVATTMNAADTGDDAARSAAHRQRAQGHANHERNEDAGKIGARMIA